MDSVLQHRPLLRCEPEYGAIVCLTCNNGFPKTRIARHLRDTHHFSIDVYAPILESFRQQHGEALADDWSKLKLSRPADGSASIEGLKVRPGYACTGCEHRTTGDYVVKGHSKCARAFRRVDLQCWNMNGAPAYWIVVAPPPPPVGSMDTTAANGPFISQTGMNDRYIAFPLLFLFFYFLFY